MSNIITIKQKHIQSLLQEAKERLRELKEVPLYSDDQEWWVREHWGNIKYMQGQIHAYEKILKA